MYKDFAIEETKSFPISGSPQYNPNYSYAKHNIVINCDSWHNYDSKSFNGSDDGGDADGFAAKLFPDPVRNFTDVAHGQIPTTTGTYTWFTIQS